ncbi:MAG: 50S ribosomal protein L17 [Patescibacteria group bacterium]
MKTSLSRKDNHRKSLIRNLATSLILYEEIRTTLPKAKEVKSQVEHLLADAQKNNLASYRKLLSFLYDSKAVLKISEVLIPRYKDQKTGYIQIFRIKPRLGDSAPMAILKLISDKEKILDENLIKDKNAAKYEKNTDKPKAK